MSSSEGFDDGVWEDFDEPTEEQAERVRHEDAHEWDGGGSLLAAFELEELLNRSAGWAQRAEVTS